MSDYAFFVVFGVAVGAEILRSTVFNPVTVLKETFMGAAGGSQSQAAGEGMPAFNPMTMMSQAA